MLFIFNVFWRRGATGGVSNVTQASRRERRKLTDAQLYANEQRRNHGESQLGADLDSESGKRQKCLLLERPALQSLPHRWLQRRDVSDQSDHRRFYLFWWECPVTTIHKHNTWKICIYGIQAFNVDSVQLLLSNVTEAVSTDWFLARIHCLQGLLHFPHLDGYQICPRHMKWQSVNGVNEGRQRGEITCSKSRQLKLKQGRCNSVLMRHQDPLSVTLVCFVYFF